MQYNNYYSTLVTRYIKYLLASERLPSGTIIHDGQRMHEGRYYIHGQTLLYCSASGLFGESTLATAQSLTVSEILQISDRYGEYRRAEEGGSGTVWATHALEVTDSLVDFSLGAHYYIVDADLSSYDNMMNFYTFCSNTSYYDFETHYYLGEYLRWMRNTTGVDVLPLYNWFGGQTSDDLALIHPTLSGKESKYRTLLVPIHFDTTYTIAIDAPLGAVVYPVIYDNTCGVLKVNSRDTDGVVSEILLTDCIESSVIKGANFRFQDRFLVNVSSVATTKVAADIGKDAYDLTGWDSRLYIAVNIPKSTTPKLSVIEGDHQDHYAVDIVSVDKACSFDEETYTQSLSSQLSLLTSGPYGGSLYSPKLIEYLCGNTIDSREQHSENIQYIRKLLNSKETQHAWTKTLQAEVFSKYQKLNPSCKDNLGYVDSDVENSLRRGWLA